MNKIFCLVAAFLLMVSFISDSLAFELHGCWKTDSDNKRDNVICFNKNSVLTKQYEFNDVIYSTKDDKIIVKIPSTWATLIIRNEGDDIIFMDADMGPKKQKYIRISEEEAKEFLR